MDDLVEEFKGTDKYVIGIKDIVDTDYMEKELRKYFETVNS